MAGLRLKTTLTYILFTGMMIIVMIVIIAVYFPIAMEKYHIQVTESEASPQHDQLEHSIRNHINLVTVERIGSGMIIMLLLSAGSLAFLHSHWLIRPILELSRASRYIADGRLSMRVNERGNDELAELARSFNQMAEELESIEERRMRLIGDVAHELRNPITGIISTIEAIGDGAMANSPENLNAVLAEAGRMKQLVKDLEVLSKLSADTIPINPESFNLRELVEAVMKQLEPQYECREIRFSLESALTRAPIHSDPARVSQILHNLFSNALRYTPNQGRVDVMLSAKTGKYSILVRDTGVGIEHEDLKRIFERFYRADSTQTRAAGSGIGLTVSLKLARHLGGDLNASSDGAGRGSEFVLSLPEKGQFRVKESRSNAK